MQAANNQPTTNQHTSPSDASSTTWHASLHVTDDAMKVYLILDTQPGQWPVPALTIEAVQTQLTEMGITAPIDQERVTQLLQDPVAVCAPIAAGTLPRPGREGRLELLVRDDREDGPREREDGSVDYRERSPWVHVEAGTPLAVLQPPGRGRDGSDVYGRKIPAPEGPPLRIRTGRGVCVITPATDPATVDPVAFQAAAPILEELGPNAEGVEVYVALQGGRPVIDRRRPGQVTLEVRPYLEIAGDVDLSTGHVRFDGDVAVRGNVADEMIIEAGGDVLVHGSVDRAQIRAGKKVDIRGGTVQSRIEAGDNARLFFINQSHVTAGRYVEIGPRGAYLATVQAPIVVARGPVIGGEVHVVKRLEALEAGSEMGARTTLVAEAGGELRVRTAHPQVLVRVGRRNLVLTRLERALRCRLVGGELVLH